MAAIPSLNSHYDEEADLMAVWWERPAKIVCVESVPGVFLHVNPHTDEVVGYEIEDFRARYQGRRTDELPLPTITTAQRQPLETYLEGEAQTTSITD
jgi:hypothetical protein